MHQAPWVQMLILSVCSCDTLGKLQLPELKSSHLCSGHILAQCLAHGKNLISVSYYYSPVVPSWGHRVHVCEYGIWNKDWFAEILASGMGKAKSRHETSAWFVALGPGPLSLLTSASLTTLPRKPPSSTAEFRVALACKAAKDGHRIPQCPSWTASRQSHTPTHFTGEEAESRKGRQSVWPSYTGN